jgi:hypothetical protein
MSDIPDSYVACFALVPNQIRQLSRDHAAISSDVGHHHLVALDKSYFRSSARKGIALDFAFAIGSPSLKRDISLNGAFVAQSPPSNSLKTFPIKLNLPPKFNRSSASFWG